MAELLKELGKKEYYYTIRMNDESFYMCKVKDSNDVFTVEEQDGMDVISGTNVHNHNFLQLTDVFVIVQTQSGPVPVEYYKMPGGSKVLWVNIKNIASFNVIDSKSKLVDALDQIASGIITETELPSAAQSPRSLKR